MSLAKVFLTAMVLLPLVLFGCIDYTTPINLVRVSPKPLDIYVINANPQVNSFVEGAEVTLGIGLVNNTGNCPEYRFTEDFKIVKKTDSRGAVTFSVDEVESLHTSVNDSFKTWRFRRTPVLKKILRVTRQGYVTKYDSIELYLSIESGRRFLDEENSEIRIFHLVGPDAKVKSKEEAIEAMLAHSSTPGAFKKGTNKFSVCLIRQREWRIKITNPEIPYNQVVSTRDNPEIFGGINIDAYTAEIDIR